MHKIVSLAAMEERRECMEMGKSQQALDQAVNRFEELSVYRHNYVSRPVPAGNISAIRWHDYQNFLSRLDTAMRVQKDLVLDGEQNVDAHRRRWMAKRQRLESLERVLERYRTAEQLQDERSAQKLIDDLPTMKDFFEDGS